MMTQTQAFLSYESRAAENWTSGDLNWASYQIGLIVNYCWEFQLNAV